MGSFGKFSSTRWLVGPTLLETHKNLAIIPLAQLAMFSSWVLSDLCLGSAFASIRLCTIVISSYV
jgi:hypothetical protein